MPKKQRKTKTVFVKKFFKTIPFFFLNFDSIPCMFEKLSEVLIQFKRKDQAGYKSIYLNRTQIIHLVELHTKLGWHYVN